MSPKRLPRDTRIGVIWDGLGLIPYSIAPHFKSNHSESGRVDAMVRSFVDHKMPFVALRDGEVIISVADLITAWSRRACVRRSVG